ncbi:MAG: MFS transporter [Planctomycetota bacterium]
MSSQGILDRLCLRRSDHRAWALYDWANSAFVTVVITAVFPVYFEQVAALGLDDRQASLLFGTATTVSMLVIAVAAPLLGSLADFRALRKRFLLGFMSVGALATAGLFFVGEGDAQLAAVLFALASIGATGSFVFYDSLLPHLAEGEELDRLSTTAYSLGYLGGGLLLAVNVAMIVAPAVFGLPSGEDLSPSERTLPTRLVFLTVSIWWVVFSIPLMRRVPEPPRVLEDDEQAGDHPLRVAVQRLAETFRELRVFRQALLMLGAYLIYNDGIGTIIRMSTFFGAQKGLESDALIQSILLVQFVGVPAAIGFGKLSGVLGTKRAILVGLAAYIVITGLAFGLEDEADFLVLAVAVGLVMGGTQALSRSLFASLIPPHKATEFFALFAVFEKFAGLLGPAAFTAVAASVEDPSWAILVVLPMFVIGGVLLLFVDVDAGRAAARAAERGARAVELPPVAD